MHELAVNNSATNHIGHTSDLFWEIDPNFRWNDAAVPNDTLQAFTNLLHDNKDV